MYNGVSDIAQLAALNRPKFLPMSHKLHTYKRAALTQMLPSLLRKNEQSNCTPINQSILQNLGDAIMSRKLQCLQHSTTEALHKVQCIGRFVHRLRAEALAITPHRMLVGSKGQFVKMTDTSLPWPLRSYSVVHSLLP